ncbi:MAG: S9 family peptidase [Acidobacteria bacterium]|nr:S9 family peptidase [Acidobacteriota bacterium]
MRNIQQRRAVCALCVLPVLLSAGPARAQQKRLTLDDLYDPQKKVNFNGRDVGSMTWLDDGHYVMSSADEGDRARLVRVEAASGRREPLYDAAKMQSALSKMPAVSRDEAGRLSRSGSYTMNAATSAAVLSIADDLYYYEFGADQAARLTSAAGQEEEVTFSPDGRMIAFVRNSNLFIVDVATARERPVTTDGSAETLNGKLDWVYQEEIYGRGHFRAYWWSPDSTHVAFLQLDERPVPEFVVVDDLPYDQHIEKTDYPQAGDPNPIVRLGVASAAGGQPHWIDVEKYGAIEFLIVDVSWSPDSQAVVFQVQDREQTWLDLNMANRGSGAVTTWLRETTKAWVEPIGSPAWLSDGTFVWTSERSGWRHLYLYRADATLARPITSGEWEVRRLYGIDEKQGWVYFAATERSPIGVDVYRIKLDGTGFQRVSQAPGTHAATFNPSFTLYLDGWSDVTTPPVVRLHRADGTDVRTVEANNVAALAEYRLSKPEFLTVTTRDGFVMEAMMIKPADFDPLRKYPVYQSTYGGPRAPRVRNAWGETTYMFHQLLAERGIIVWMCDNRTASGKGAQSAWPLYRNFGELELRDIEDGVAWLTQQPYVDGARIGISGWSYGGFMTSYALTHSTSFAMGIAGGSVTDWRDYDSIYTERYMRMPQNNPEGYLKSAPRFAAANLHGRLLLIHGAIDDNVHVQNTLQFAYELQKADKPFELMVYPKSRHAVADAHLAKHLRTLMLDFILKTLKPDESGRPLTSRGRP